MFDLHVTYTNPIRRTRTAQRFQLGKNRGLPPALAADPDAYLVELTADDDPANAKNWVFSRKMIASFILVFDTLVASWGSSVYASAIVPVSHEFHVGTVTSTLGLTLYICGFAVGPMAFGPLSEVYGRKPPITVACFFFNCFMFAAATAKDFQTLMISRFFAGIFAACPLVVVGGSVADMFGNETRGKAVAVFTAMIMCGPLASPIASAFITQSYLGWRWTQYITGIMGALALFLDVFFLEETYLNTILQKRAAFIRRETGNFAVHHVSEEDNIDFNELVKRQLLLPMRLLFLEPIVFLMTLYNSFIYGIQYLFLEAYPVVFVDVRHIDEALSTLMYIGLIIGAVIGCGIILYFEPRYNRKVRENGGLPVPEERLLPMMVGATLFPIGLFWFALTGNYASINWAVPALSGLLTGAGMFTITLQALNYIIDAYLSTAASALSANAILRAFFAAGFPLFARQMFKRLGVKWAGCLLGFLGLAFLPIPFLFYIFGEKLRGMSRYAPTDSEAPSTNVGNTDQGARGNQQGVLAKSEHSSHKDKSEECSQKEESE